MPDLSHRAATAMSQNLPGSDEVSQDTEPTYILGFVMPTAWDSANMSLPPASLPGFADGALRETARLRKERDFLLSAPLNITQAMPFTLAAAIPSVAVAESVFQHLPSQPHCSHAFSSTRRPFLRGLSSSSAGPASGLLRFSLCFFKVAASC